MKRKEAGGTAARLAVFASLAAGLLAPPASAQQPTESGPLRFLRPSVGSDVEPVVQSPVPAPEAVAPVEQPDPTEAAAPAIEPTAPQPTAEPPAGTAPAPAVAEPAQPLRLGVRAGRDPAVTLRRLSSLAAGLSEELGRPVEMVPMSSYGALIDSQRLGRIDGGFFSAAAYAMAQSGCSCLDPLVAPAASDGTRVYYSVLVIPSGSDAEELADLKGRTLAVAGEDSIGGRRLPLAALMADGVDPEELFAEIRNAGSAEGALKLLLTGAVDAAFAWTSLSGDIGAGYSRGTLADLVARGEMAMSEVAVLWRSPPIAHGPFAVGPAVAEAEKARIEAYLLGLEQSDPPAYDLLNPYYPGGYVAVDREDYDDLAALTEQDIDSIRIGSNPALSVTAAPQLP